MEEKSEAIELWEKGFSKETAGAMTDAIKYYRLALRINPNVEKLYRKKLQEEWRLEEEMKKLQLNPNGNSDGLSDAVVDVTVRENTEDLSQDDDQIELPCWILNMLPDDLLTKIIDHIVLTSADSWVNLSLTCKKFNSLCFHDSSPYRTFAEYIYKKQVYNDNEMRLNGISDIKTLAETLWGQDDRKMLKERPYIKFHGVYISVVNYLRHGSIPEGSSSLLNPIHMITYYRYLRFYPNGKCMRLLTTDEPSVVVPELSIEEHANKKDVEICSWSLSLEEGLGQLKIQRTRAKDSLKFQEELKISNRGQRKFSKLKWVSSSATKVDGTNMQFSLSKEKPFHFSKVKSYHI
ncbi:unnamed protein product [Kluyveromyces dobzhanskii CBS 2104]|uniref:WGS project CCBQ000000000 data, contig 00058 n=1 Tax=Kluyveromyces dobzhanskii CBS 2104 TaxID=1427455 RepID=A0A0A8LDC9_9SACH|nr:unnamed protein product [Kluyveromyces dobzhanskii CBS 2104]